MANDHPFQILFEALGRVPACHAELVNRQAHEVLSDILKVPVEKAGRFILLRSPRAGHGKTHLLSRILHQLGSSHEFVPLRAAYGCRIDAASVMDDMLRRLVRQLPVPSGLTMLDLITRRLFASALQPLVASGDVPCQDREGALTALRNRPIEAFDFHHPDAVTAHWAKENFETLGQRLALELAQRGDLPVGATSFWVGVLFQFATAPLECSNRVRMLWESVHAGVGLELERLESLLGLVTQLTRVVLVADDLEGFSSDETSALRLAAFLGSLRQSTERMDVILSLNQDTWQSAFVPRLSGGLTDRLSEVVVELEPLTGLEMEALLNSRAPGLGRRLLDCIDVAAAGTHARGLIRAAGMVWVKETATVSALAEATELAIPPPTSDLAPPAAAVADKPVVEPQPVVEALPKVPGPALALSVGAPFETAAGWSAPALLLPSDRELASETLSYQASTPDSPPKWQEPAPAPSTEVAPVDSPSPTASEPTTPALPAEAQAVSPPPPPDEAPPPPGTQDTDRVDDVLRQFRERYGPGSL